MADKPRLAVRGWFAKGNSEVTKIIYFLLIIDVIKQACYIAEAEAYQKVSCYKKNKSLTAWFTCKAFLRYKQLLALSTFSLSSSTWVV